MPLVVWPPRVAARQHRCRASARRWLAIAAAALGVAMALGNCFAGAPAEQPIDEYQMKAAFLYNFAKFVTWPGDSFAGPNDAIAICVVGWGPFGHWLEDTVKGKAVEGRGLAVRHISSLGELHECHILFIGSSEEKGWLSRLAGVGKAGILTVGESDAAGAAGVIVNFKLEDEGNKVRFEINNRVAERQRLQISSKLLSLACGVRK
jgi:hypothetical protein